MLHVILFLYYDMFSNCRLVLFLENGYFQGGINNKDLRIALEPEAASLYCRLMPAEKILDHRGNSVIATFKRGHKYMVLDAGGISSLKAPKQC